MVFLMEPEGQLPPGFFKTCIFSKGKPFGYQAFAVMCPHQKRRWRRLDRISDVLHYLRTCSCCRRVQPA